jgi:hypothetical protein
MLNIIALLKPVQPSIGAFEIRYVQALAKSAALLEIMCPDKV